MSKQSLSFGSDPEIFLVERGTNKLVPPEYLIHFKGLKPVRVDVNEAGVRHPIFVEKKTFSIIGDGALFEFTLKPSKDIGVLYRRFLLAMEALTELAERYNLDVLHSPIADFDVNRYFKGMDNELVKFSSVAGCDPDDDAIDEGYESKVRNLTHWDKRGAGGHLHVGVDNFPELHEMVIPAIRLLAVFVGNTYIKHVTDLKAELARQEVFGKAGRYRVQQYGETPGIEYRTPSNTWLNGEESVQAVGEATRRAIALLSDEKKGVKILDDFLPDTIKAIHNVDVDLSTSILKAVA